MLYRSPPSDWIARARVRPLSVAPPGRRPGGGGGGGVLGPPDWLRLDVLKGWGSSGRINGWDGPFPHELNIGGVPLPPATVVRAASDSTAPLCPATARPQSGIGGCHVLAGHSAERAAVERRDHHGLLLVGFAVPDIHAAGTQARAALVQSRHSCCDILRSLAAPPVALSAQRVPTMVIGASRLAGCCYDVLLADRCYGSHSAGHCHGALALPAFPLWPRVCVVLLPYGHLDQRPQHVASKAIALSRSPLQHAGILGKSTSYCVYPAHSDVHGAGISELLSLLLAHRARRRSATGSLRAMAVRYTVLWEQAVSFHMLCSTLSSLPHSSSGPPHSRIPPGVKAGSLMLSMDGAHLLFGGTCK
eukprot:2212849-Amphidinium_carterae.5